MRRCRCTSLVGAGDVLARGHGLELCGGAATDLFSDSAGGSLANAQALIGPAPEGDFLFSARVRPELASTFNAGVLFVYRDEKNWAKLCLERSPRASRPSSRS